MSKNAYVLTGGETMSEAMGEFRVIDRNRSPEFIPPRDYVADILEATADRFESGELNWYQGDFVAVDLDGHTVGHCAIGGLCTVTGEDWGRANKPVVAAAAEAMRPHIFRQVQDHLKRESPLVDWVDMDVYPAENLVITFNDQLARDVSEVVDVMKQAAKDLRNQS
jgi:hypothetical protein